MRNPYFVTWLNLLPLLVPEIGPSTFNTTLMRKFQEKNLRSFDRFGGGGFLLSILARRREPVNSVRVNSVRLG